MGQSAGRPDDDIHETSNAGLKVRLSQPGLDYGAAIAVDVLAARLRGISIPDQIGRCHIPVVGSVDYEIRHIQITDLIKPTTTVVVQPTVNGLMWSLTNAGISIRGNWHVKYRVVFQIEDSGSFEGHVTGASLAVSVSLGATPSGLPTINSTGCYCRISSIKMTLLGGASWLYNLFMRNVEKSLRYQLQTLLCDEARKAIDEEAAVALATLYTRVQVSSQLVLDYGLVASPSFYTGYIETFHRGEFLYVGDSSRAPFKPSPLLNPHSSPRMVTFWISDYVLNTAGYAMHKNGGFHRVVTKKDLSSTAAVLLNLTCCSNCQCIGRLLPSASKLYPKASVEFDLQSTSPPTATIGRKSVTVTLTGTTILNARLTNGKEAYLLKLKVEANSAAMPSFDGSTLRFKIKSMAAKVSVIHSAIGSVSDTVLNFVINIIIKNYVLPRLNEAGTRGIPLPHIAFVRFINAGMQLQQNAICLSTDLKYITEDDDISSSSIQSSVGSTTSELYYDPVRGSSHSLATVNSEKTTK